MISTLFRSGSESSRSFAAEHCRRRPLRCRIESWLAELRFHQPRQREIEIVAAQQQVLADGGARELDAVAIARHADQAEVAGAAADVADQHHLAIEEQLARVREVVGDPGIERRGRLFEQRELRGSPASRAAITVSSRASSSNEAGTVSTMSCSRERARVAPSSQASRILARKRAETSTGESTRPASCESHGRIFAVRSTSGIRQPAISPSAPAWWAPARPARAHTRRPAGPSSRNRNDGSVRRASTRPGATNCGISRDVDGRESWVFALARIDAGKGRVGGAEVDADVHACDALPHVEFELPAAAVARHAPQLQHPGFGDDGFERHRHDTRPSSSAGSCTSMGESSSRSSPKSSISAPGASFLRAAELKKRNSAGSPTTRPNSRSGNAQVGAFFHAERRDGQGFSGAGMPGTAGMAALDADIIGARHAAADAHALAVPRQAVISRAARDGVHQIFAAQAA